MFSFCPTPGSKWWAVAALTVLLSILCAGGLFAWRYHTDQSVLVLESPTDSLAILVYSDSPPHIIDRVLGSDQRPSFNSWGGDPAELRKCKCVFHRSAEAGTWRIPLRPGIYTIVTHRQSRCGFWGGDTSETVELPPGETLLHRVPGGQ